jgi:hypothetical protein
LCFFPFLSFFLLLAAWIHVDCRLCWMFLCSLWHPQINCQKMFFVLHQTMIIILLSLIQTQLSTLQQRSLRMEDETWQRKNASGQNLGPTQCTTVSITRKFKVIFCECNTILAFEQKFNLYFGC